jgi:hypothetical protein
MSEHDSNSNQGGNTPGGHPNGSSCDRSSSGYGWGSTGAEPHKGPTPGTSQIGNLTRRTGQSGKKTGRK